LHPDAAKTIAIVDTTSGKGGYGDGFHPHELLEAALATCMNMTIRMYAQKHAIISPRVSLFPDSPSLVCSTLNFSKK
jgi:putative redox protein